jgi:DNA-binding NtrC family response regulator
MMFNPRTRVLIVDDDAATARYLQAHLARRNFEVSTAGNGEEGIRMFRVSDPHVVLLDLSTPGTNGIDTLERIKQIKPEVAVIVLSSQNDSELIFRASKLGADDYVGKPLDPKDLEIRMAKVLDKQRLVTEVTQLRDQVRRQSDFTTLFGTSPKMEEVKMTIEQVAGTNATVLVRGESGTGKEVVARMVHAQSSRRDKPFVKVNCSAIPRDLLESELFGYEAGAFTGANRQKLGKFDQANNGTMFLDEIGEMHPALQANLLHALQDGEFSRLGGKRDIAVDVRVLAATNKPLERAVEEGSFREDLFYRLNVVTIHIPPLRERREEIPLFLDLFLRRYSEYYGKNPPAFSEHAMARMLDYSWPGNIRELENLVKRYVIVGNEAQIMRELSTHQPIVSSLAASAPVGLESEAVLLPAAAPPANGSAALSAATGAVQEIDSDKEAETPSLLEIGRQAAKRAEKEAIERVLTQTRWNRRQAARILKISYKALLNKLKAMEGNLQGASGHLHTH